MMTQLNWVDLALGFVLVLSVVIGLWRGLVYELLSLIGWVVAFVVAQLYGPVVSVWLPLGASGSTARLAFAYGVTFVATLIVWTLLAKLVRLMISATPLSVLDRALGCAFGFARGVVILLLVTLLAGFTPLAHEPAWQGSYGVRWLETLLHSLQSMLPSKPARGTA
jgi:membrane protein required for colicin V production